MSRDGNSECGCITHETYRRNGPVDFDDSSDVDDDSGGIDIIFGTIRRVFPSYPNLLMPLFFEKSTNVSYQTNLAKVRFQGPSRCHQMQRQVAFSTGSRYRHQ
ncbi:MAG: hypothetical protein JWM11_977 [Planctomycetaceae bacterium]|nr:hypothetical protein [Planctomycetaceae bacterium]